MEKSKPVRMGRPRRYNEPTSTTSLIMPHSTLKRLDDAIKAGQALSRGEMVNTALVAYLNGTGEVTDAERIKDRLEEEYCSEHGIARMDGKLISLAGDIQPDIHRIHEKTLNLIKNMDLT